MTKIIDMHCHVVPHGFPAAPPSCCAQWPSMDHRDAETGVMMIGDKPFRPLDPRSWDPDRRIADMNIDGVTMQVVSPMPELLSYWIDVRDAVTLTRHINQDIATLVAHAPDRFAGMGIVPLQDPQIAADELPRLRDLGLVGVEIGSNILGRSPGDPFFDPFYAEAERLGLAIFVHALHPTTTDRIIGSPMVSVFVGFPSDVGFAAASFISGGVLEKFPNLRVAFSHGGGTLASFLPRLQKGWERTPALNTAFADPQVTARRFYYDNVVFDPSLLKHLIGVFGDTQICVGSDYPYSGGQEQSAGMFDGLGLTPAQMKAVLSGNAARYLKLDA